MILTCPECATSYSTPKGAIGTEGRNVKCRKCAHIWFARESHLEHEEGDETSVENTEIRERKSDNTGAADSESLDNVAPGDIDDVDDVDWSSAEHDDSEADMATGGADRDEPAPVVESYESAAMVTRSDIADAANGNKSWFKSVPVHALAVAASLVLIFGAGFVFRQQVVGMMPGTASLFATIGYPVNLRGLEIKNVSFERGFEDGMPVLSIRGDIVNVTKTHIEVPKIRFALRDEHAREIYYWTGAIGQENLAPGRSVPFVTRLASPPVAARNVMIRFSGQAPG